MRDVYVDDQVVELSLWDTGGMSYAHSLCAPAPPTDISRVSLIGAEELDRLRSLNFPGTHVVILSFSVRRSVSTHVCANFFVRWTSQCR